MGLFSFAGKSKQNTVSNDSEFYSHAEEESTTVRRRKRKQSQEGNDPVLPEKKRARRRLVGAVALVLAVIIGLPMILDSEPKPLNSDIAIEIPSKDKPSSEAPESAEDESSSATLPASASLDKNEEIVDLSKDKSAVVSSTVSQQNGPPQPAQAETINSPQLQTRTALSDTEKGADDERARALLEGQPDPKAEKSKLAANEKNNRIAVQVAALASQEKVNELQNKLKNAGIKSYTSKVATQSGERIRVRIGPFSSKEEAEKVRAKLVNLGLGGTLVPV